MSVYYLATPYSSYPYGLDNAFRAACRAAACLTEAGVQIYSPVAHWHPISLFMENRPADFWIELNKPHMRAAPGLIIAQLPGWDKSAGISLERTIFEQMGKPVKFLRWPAMPYRMVITSVD